MKHIIFLLLLIPSIAFTQTATFDVEFISNNDGDTFYCYVYIPSNKRNGVDFRKKKVKCRLYQCDTFERDQDNPDCENLQVDEFIYCAKAEAAFYLTKKFLLNDAFTIKYHYKDKYSRWIVQVLFEDGSTLKGRLKELELLTGKYENMEKHHKKIKY